MMLQDRDFLEIKFPIQNKNLEGAKTLVLRSSDVVGVGAVRKTQLQQIKNEKRIVLLDQKHFFSAHLAPAYELELVKTLTWLRPAEVRIAELDFIAEQKVLFEKIFPKTILKLGDLSDRIRDLYLQQKDVTSWLLQDHWIYFVGHLRQQYPGNETLLQVAHWEWVQAWLEIQGEESSVGSSEILQINDSLQVVPIGTQAGQELSLQPGVYGIWIGASESLVCSYSLSAQQALLLDLLQEDRKYTASQLIDQAALEDLPDGTVSRDFWENSFNTLLEKGIIKRKS